MVLLDSTRPLDELDIHSLDRYHREGYPWAAWDRLRDEAPVYRYERPGIEPFWAITRYADVRAVGSDNTRFINGGSRLRLAPSEHDELLRGARLKKAERHGWDPLEVDDMVYLDQPRHTAFRMLVARQFTPARCRRMGNELTSLAQRFVGEFEAALAAADGPVDLVDELAVKLPLATICSMMGVSVERWSDIHRWTDSLFNTDSMAWSQPGESRRDMRKRLRIEYFEFIEDLIAEKRAHPGDDLSSILVHAKVDGAALTQQQLHGYLTLLIAAGNETTRNATTRGILALIDHPEELARFDAAAGAPNVVEPAVEEIVRWTSPVIQFARTAVVDVELHGHTIRAGDTVGVWYPSANRDERAFPEPYRFDVTREPNDHVGFGHGPHFCLGANLARWELRAVFAELSRRAVVSRLALAGPAEWMTDLHVGAISHQLVISR